MQNHEFRGRQCAWKITIFCLYIYVPSCASQNLAENGIELVPITDRIFQHGISQLVIHRLWPANNSIYARLQFIVNILHYRSKNCYFAILTEHHAMKAYWRSRGTVPCILDVGTRLRWMVSFMPRPFCPQGKSPWYPLDRRLGVSQSHGMRRKICNPYQDSNPRSSSP
jgi:hypothetical protein